MHDFGFIVLLYKFNTLDFAIFGKKFLVENIILLVIFLNYLVDICCFPSRDFVSGTVVICFQFV